MSWPALSQIRKHVYRRYLNFHHCTEVHCYSAISEKWFNITSFHHISSVHAVLLVPVCVSCGQFIFSLQAWAITLSLAQAFDIAFEQWEVSATLWDAGQYTLCTAALPSHDVSIPSFFNTGLKFTSTSSTCIFISCAVSDSCHLNVLRE